MRTLILSAGKIDYTRLPFGMHQSNATIPVNGKPVISWILDDLIQKGFTSINIVVREENHLLKQLLQKYYSKRIQLSIISVTNPTSILNSLQEGLTHIAADEDGIQIILGDTLIYDSFRGLKDILFISNVDTSENWCTVQTDELGNLLGLVDKKVLPGINHLALCGYYQLSDFMLLKDSVNLSIQEKACELSHTLMHYHSKQPFALKQVETWFDFGHLETFIQSKKSLLRPRYFNMLTIDPLLNTITKVSEKTNKLEDEINWYKSLPEVLQTLTPRIITTKEESQKVMLTQEFYGYPTLSELFVYGDLSVPVWKSIIDYLFLIHNLFKSYQKKVKSKYFEDMYETKTKKRVDQLLHQNSFWQVLWNEDTVTINDYTYNNIKNTLNTLQYKIKSLSAQNTFYIIHGDYCLSNILYDLSNQIVRLIDPRGSFGEKGIYGDARYDVAKLRHSIVGLYDYIIGDLFQISYKEGVFEFELFESEKNTPLANYFDSCLINNGYKLEEIKLIEGLLFLSMIPYHSDYFERQQMMYLKSVMILNELI